MSSTANIIIDLCLASADIYVAMMPNPSTHFGEGLFGKKLIPYPVINAGLLIMAGLLVINAFTTWQQQS